MYLGAFSNEFPKMRTCLQFLVGLTLLSGCSPVKNLDFIAEPTFGSVSLGAEFQSDPYVKVIYPGGTDQVANLIPGCNGYVNFSVPPAPDFRIFYTSNNSPLSIFVNSLIDTTLVINDPVGNYYCSDDFEGLSSGNPGIEFSTPFSGTYDIWVGTHQYNSLINEEFKNSMRQYWNGTTQLPDEYPTSTLYVAEIGSEHWAAIINATYNDVAEEQSAQPEVSTQPEVASTLIENSVQDGPGLFTLDDGRQSFAFYRLGVKTAEIIFDQLRECESAPAGWLMASGQCTETGLEGEVTLVDESYRSSFTSHYVSNVPVGLSTQTLIGSDQVTIIEGEALGPDDFSYATLSNDYVNDRGEPAFNAVFKGNFLGSNPLSGNCLAETEWVECRYSAGSIITGADAHIERDIELLNSRSAAKYARLSNQLNRIQGRETPITLYLYTLQNGDPTFYIESRRPVSNELANIPVKGNPTYLDWYVWGEFRLLECDNVKFCSEFGAPVTNYFTTTAPGAVPMQNIEQGMINSVAHLIKPINECEPFSFRLQFDWHYLTRPSNDVLNLVEGSFLSPKSPVYQEYIQTDSLCAESQNIGIETQISSTPEETYEDITSTIDEEYIDQGAADNYSDSGSYDQNFSMCPTQGGPVLISEASGFGIDFEYIPLQCHENRRNYMMRNFADPGSLCASLKSNEGFLGESPQNTSVCFCGPDLRYIFPDTDPNNAPNVCWAFFD